MPLCVVISTKFLEFKRDFKFFFVIIKIVNSKPIVSIHGEVCFQEILIIRRIAVGIFLHEYKLLENKKEIRDREGLECLFFTKCN